MSRPNRADDQGFVLIGVVWLMLLCTAIVGAIMLRSHELASETATEGAVLQERLDVDAALQTVAADILMDGVQSRWGRLPAQGRIMLDDRPVTVTVTSEAARLDLNDVDPGYLDRALLALDVPSVERGRFIEEIVASREGGRIGNSAEIDRMISEAGIRPSPSVCLSDLVTLDSGLSQPRPGLSSQLDRALGVATAGQGSVLRAGEALRVEMHASAGLTATAVVRIVGLERPVDVLQWWLGPSCRRQTI